MFELGGIGDHQCGLPIVTTRDVQDREISGISVKLLRGGGGADGAGLGREPLGKTLFRNDFYLGCGLPAIGLDQIAIVGHPALIATTIQQGEKQMALHADFLKRLPLLFLFLLAACSWSEPDVIELPRDIGPTSDAFVAALQKGDRVVAERHVAPTARDELSAHFSNKSNYLKAEPKLTPRFITYKPEHMMGPEDSEVTIIYAAKDGGKWTTAEVRLFRLNDEPYEVDYWKISNDTPVAKTYSPDLKPMFGVFAGLAGAIVVLGLLTIGIVLWIVRRKPHVVAPEPVSERRVAAVTTREAENEGH